MGAPTASVRDSQTRRGVVLRAPLRNTSTPHRAKRDEETLQRVTSCRSIGTQLALYMVEGTALRKKKCSMLKPQIIRGDELILDTFYSALQSVPATAQFAADGTIYSQPDLLKKVDSMRTPYKTVRSGVTALSSARADLDSQRPAIKTFVKALQTAIKGYMGEDSPEMVTFGFKPNKVPTPLTASEKALKAEKALQTRAENHTKGKKQKAALDAGQAPAASTTPAPPVVGGNGK